MISMMPVSALVLIVDKLPGIRCAKANAVTKIVTAQAEVQSLRKIGGLIIATGRLKRHICRVAVAALGFTQGSQHVRHQVAGFVLVLVELNA